MVRALAEQGERLRERVSELEQRLGIAREEPTLDTTFGDVGEMPRADGG
jgi:hypothetical protein